METMQLQTVLITGASSGIGFELARLFARDHYHLILVAHHVDKLDHAAQQLQGEFAGVRLHTIAIDLSKDDAPEKLFAHVQQQGWSLDVLVNNAGFGEYGLFAQTNLQKELALIHLNVIALVHLTKLFLPYMLNRGSGKILQLGSVASFTPTPLQAVYGATKAFILSFSEALREELKDTPVTVTVLCPPATATNFFNVAGAQDSKIAQGNLATAEEVAAGGYEALMKGDARAVPTLKAKIQVAQSTILPDALNATFMHKQSEETKPKKSSTKKGAVAPAVTSTPVSTTDVTTPVTTGSSKTTKAARAPKASQETIIIDNTEKGADIEITPKKPRTKKSL